MKPIYSFLIGIIIGIVLVILLRGCGGAPVETEYTLKKIGRAQIDTVYLRDTVMIVKYKVATKYVAKEAESKQIRPPDTSLILKDYYTITSDTLYNENATVFLLDTLHGVCKLKSRNAEILTNFEQYNSNRVDTLKIETVKTVENKRNIRDAVVTGLVGFGVGMLVILGILAQ